MKIIDILSGKKILVWGYGREGKSTEQFINMHKIDCSIEIFEGKYEDIQDEKYDLIIKSPGIKCHVNNPKFTSQTEMFLSEFADKVIGITGTKGKSTTSALLYTVLKECGKKVLLVGNIGLPCLDQYDDIDEDSVIVYEMSCHQLAHARTSPHIALLLNLYEEHLDYYDTMENYANAKFNIYKFQKGQDTFIVNKDIELIYQSKGQKIEFSYDNLEMSFDMKLIGQHNQFNANIVYYIATKIYGLDRKKVIQVIDGFEGLPHRMQLIGEVNGVKYYDDSISTICESTIQAVKSLDNVGTVIIGGMDRGIDYSVLCNYFKENTQVKMICMYASGKKIYDMLRGRPNMYVCNDLMEAVNMAKEITDSGKECVLSPAAASYDHFENFEDRGNAFKVFLGLK